MDKNKIRLDRITNILKHKYKLTTDYYNYYVDDKGQKRWLFSLDNVTEQLMQQQTREYFKTICLEYIAKCNLSGDFESIIASRNVLGIKLLIYHFHVLWMLQEHNLGTYNIQELKDKPIDELENLLDKAMKDYNNEIGLDDK